MRGSCRGCHAERTSGPRLVARRARRRAVYEYFCGTGGVGFACRAFGVPSKLFDLALGQDLTNRGRLQQIYSDAAKNVIGGGVLAPTCDSWSQAKGLAARLRTKKWPWGRPDVSAEHKTYLAHHNKIMRAAIQIMKIHIVFRIPFVLVHPAGSRARSLPFFNQCLSGPLGGLFCERIIDQCAFGARRRKRTWLFCFGIEDPLPLARSLCCSSVCTYSNVNHSLEGRNKTAKYAEPPPQLCKVIAKVLCSPIIAESYNKRV